MLKTFFSSSLVLHTNWIECLTIESLFSLVNAARQDLTQVEYLSKAPLKGRHLNLTKISDVHKKFRDKHSSLFFPDISGNEKKLN
jgi:hypothetical protein